MELSHVLSDSFLAIICLFTFFKFLSKLNLNNTILWESFVLSVAGAAIFGAIGYAGYTDAFNLRQFFQSLAMLTGSVGIVAATLGLIFDIKLDKISTYVILTLGFLLFVLSEAFKFQILKTYVPLIAMASLFILAMVGFGRSKVKTAIWILIAVSFFALAQYRDLVFGNKTFSLDIYHILVAGGVFSLGLATMQQGEK
jgi:hypothetical protein